MIHCWRVAPVINQSYRARPRAFSGQLKAGRYRFQSKWAHGSFLQQLVIKHMERGRPAIQLHGTYALDNALKTTLPTSYTDSWLVRQHWRLNLWTQIVSTLIIRHVSWAAKDGGLWCWIRRQLSVWGLWCVTPILSWTKSDSY